MDRVAYRVACTRLKILSGHNLFASDLQRNCPLPVWTPSAFTASRQSTGLWFLVACTQLYKLLCQSICLSVCWLVHRLVGWTLDCSDTDCSEHVTYGYRPCWLLRSLQLLYKRHKQFEGADNPQHPFHIHQWILISHPSGIYFLFRLTLRIWFHF